MAHEFAVALDKTFAMRKEMGRERIPQAVYTTGEWKELKEYAAACDLPSKMIGRPLGFEPVKPWPALN